MTEEPSFTLGIEEEYLLVDPATGALAEAPSELMDAAQDRLGGPASPEVLRCQIEVGTGVCAITAEARADLSSLRRAVADLAQTHGLAPIGAQVRLI